MLLIVYYYFRIAVNSLAMFGCDQIFLSKRVTDTLILGSMYWATLWIDLRHTTQDPACHELILACEKI